MSRARYPFDLYEKPQPSQRRDSIVKRIAISVVVTGLLAMLAFAQRSPAHPPQFEVDPSIAAERVRAAGAAKETAPSTDTSINIEVNELRLQQLAIHG